jgi:hypothetical protein
VCFVLFISSFFSAAIFAKKSYRCNFFSVCIGNLILRFPRTVNVVLSHYRQLLEIGQLGCHEHQGLSAGRIFTVYGETFTGVSNKLHGMKNCYSGFGSHYTLTACCCRFITRVFGPRPEFNSEWPSNCTPPRLRKRGVCPEGSRRVLGSCYSGAPLLLRIRARRVLHLIRGI